jgi:predicted DNA-binding transcriptional regulator AlpA
MYSKTDIERVKIFLSPAEQTGQMSVESFKSIIDQLKDGLHSHQPEPPPEKDELLTKQQVMKLCDIKPPTYYVWVRKGWLKPLGKGRKVLFRKSDILNRQN